MHLLDLVTDDKTGRLSSQKLWQHIGYGVLSVALIRHVTAHELSFDLIIAYGGVVALHSVLSLYIRRRFPMEKDQ